MAKQWYQIQQHRVYGIVHVLRMSGYHIVAHTQLFTDRAYTDAEIIALVDAVEPAAAQSQYGTTALDRAWAGTAVCYEKIREPNASDPMPRLGGIVAPQPLAVLDTLADQRLVAFSREYWEQQETR